MGRSSLGTRRRLTSIAGRVIRVSRQLRGTSALEVTTSAPPGSWEPLGTVERLDVAESVKESTIGSRRYNGVNVEGESMQQDSPTYILCERIARAELAKAAQENRVRNADAFRQHVPSLEDRNARKPALCSTCGVCLYYREDREVTMVEGWPVATSECGRGYAVADCHQLQERGVDVTLAGILA